MKEHELFFSLNSIPRKELNELSSPLCSSGYKVFCPKSNFGDGCGEIDPGKGKQENFERRELDEERLFNQRVKGVISPQASQALGFCCYLFLNPVHGGKKWKNKNYPITKYEN